MAIPIRRDGRPSMSLPRVSASFSAKVKTFNVTDGKCKVLLEFGGEDDVEPIPDSLAADLLRAHKDGRQRVVLVSLRQQLAIPGTESDADLDDESKVAVGWVLREELADILAAQAAPSGRIEPDEGRSEPPVLPVGTFVGDDAGATVDARTREDAVSMARAAGLASARKRRS